jgi:hypothetical protein
LYEAVRIGENAKGQDIVFFWRAAGSRLRWFVSLLCIDCLHPMPKTTLIFHSTKVEHQGVLPVPVLAIVSVLRITESDDDSLIDILIGTAWNQPCAPLLSLPSRL